MKRQVTWIALGLLVLVVDLLTWMTPYPYHTIIRHQAEVQQVDPLLVAAVIRAESSFRPEAISSQGAVGLMQVMPSTGAWIFKQTGWTGDLRQPGMNIAVGVWYLRYLLNHYGGNIPLALAAYNSGPQVVDRWVRQGHFGAHTPIAAIPYPETRAFVRRVLWFYRAYHVVYGPVPA